MNNRVNLIIYLKTQRKACELSTFHKKKYALGDKVIMRYVYDKSGIEIPKTRDGGILLLKK